jgi:prepilin-type N-terminal cleavage/methylation domain-containing protein
MKGQTLIEVLVALGIATIVVSAITITSISSLSNASHIKDQSQATKYAQEGLETIRNIRNSGYEDFKLSYGGLYCLEAGQTVLGSPVSACSENINGKFVRSVRIEQGQCGSNVGANITSVTVEVAYTSGKCQSGTFCHKSQVTSCLSTTNPIPAP